MILQREGYITGFEVEDLPDRPGKSLTIRMKYSADRRRTISGSEARRRGPACASTRGRRRAARARRNGHRDRVDQRGPHDRP